MIKTRVYDVARELGLDNREVVSKLASLGIPVRNHMSSIDPADAERVKRAIEKDKQQNVVEERIRPTVVRHRAPRREDRSESESVAPTPVLAAAAAREPEPPRAKPAAAVSTPKPIAPAPRAEAPRAAALMPPTPAPVAAPARVERGHQVLERPFDHGRRQQAESAPLVSRTMLGAHSIGWDAFLSHASEDLEVARRIATALKSRGWRVFFAPDHLNATIGSAQWSAAIDTALDSSKTVVLIATLIALGSRWVTYEWRSFHDDILGGTDHTIIPICTGELGPRELPRALRRYQSIDLREPNPFENRMQDLDDLLRGHAARPGG